MSSYRKISRNFLIKKLKSITDVIQDTEYISSFFDENTKFSIDTNLNLIMERESTNYTFNYPESDSILIKHNNKDVIMTYFIIKQPGLTYDLMCCVLDSNKQYISYIGSFQAITLVNYCTVNIDNDKLILKNTSKAVKYEGNIEIISKGLKYVLILIPLILFLLALCSFGYLTAPQGALMLLLFVMSFISSGLNKVKIDLDIQGILSKLNI